MFEAWAAGDVVVGALLTAALVCSSQLWTDAKTVNVISTACVSKVRCSLPELCGVLRPVITPARVCMWVAFCCRKRSSS